MIKNKPSKKEERLVLYAATELAEVIIAHVHKKPELHDYGMTILGLASEMIMSSAGNKWDVVSKEFREFLVVAHKDLKKHLEYNKNLN